MIHSILALIGLFLLGNYLLGFCDGFFDSEWAKSLFLAILAITLFALGF